MAGYWVKGMEMHGKRTCTVCTSGCAPAVINTATIVSCPRCDASISAFMPSLFLRFTSEPALISCRVIFRCPSCEALIRAVVPFELDRSDEASALRRRLTASSWPK